MKISNIKLRNISITNRLRWSFFVLSLLPILIVGVFSANTSKQAIMSKSTNYIEQIVRTLGDNIENELEKYENLMDELILNTTIQQGLRDFGEMNFAQKTVMKEDIARILKRKFSSYPHIRDVKIINNDNEQIYQRGYLLNDETHIENIIDTIKMNGGVTNCFSTEIYNEKYIVMSKVIYSVYNRNKVGYVVLVLRENAVLDVYKEVNLGEGDNIILIDKNDKVLSSKQDSKKIEEQNIEEFVEAIRANQKITSNQLDFEYNNQDYMMIHNQIPNYDIEIVGGIPYKYLHKEIILISKNVILIVIICFILSMIASTIISRSITQPLHDLVDYVGAAAKQRFDKDFIDDNKDELGVVGRTFIKITKQLKEVIEQIEREQKEKTELEINMLQAQINPHFLFNTLNSLRWISMMSGAHSVSEGILALSDLLRNTIIHKAEYITIEEELDNVNNYILIQRLRYGDLFNIVLEIPEHLLEYKTLKFILQPIVENAIIHGGCEQQQMVDITIRLTEHEKQLIFEVIDNGKGFDKIEVKTARHSAKLSGIGVGNVKDRIRLNFGEEYSVQIASQPGVGTTVSLNIPKIRGEG
ncbi:MAG: sensor histidine kinase [Cellulosilyticaceae bacterium]